MTEKELLEWLSRQPIVRIINVRGGPSMLEFGHDSHETGESFIEALRRAARKEHVRRLP